VLVFTLSLFPAPGLPLCESSSTGPHCSKHPAHLCCHQCHTAYLSGKSCLNAVSPGPDLSQFPQRSILHHHLLPFRPLGAHVLRAESHHFLLLLITQELSQLIPKSAVGELSEDSSNVVQLIMDAYDVRGRWQGWAQGRGGKGSLVLQAGRT
jgi:hypothetical protein